MTKLLSKRGAMLALCVTPFLSAPAYAGDGYIGVSLGYGWGTAHANTSTVYSATGGYFTTTSVPAINATGAQKLTPNGFNGGLDAGYDFVAGNLHIGVAADISTISNGDSVSSTTTYPCCAPTSFTITQTVKPKWMATARARLGYDMGPALLYVTGGWAGARIRYSSTFTDTFATAHEAASDSKFGSGWVAGGGVDFKLGGGWSIQPEYLHADFGTISVPGGTLTAFTPALSFPANAFTHSAKVKMDIARVGIHYHF